MNSWDWYGRWQEEIKCEHIVSAPTKYKIKNGAIYIYIQCLMCGERIDTVKKNGYNLDELPEFDYELRERNRQESAQLKEEIHQEWIDEFGLEWGTQNSDWWDQYNQYLQSTHWRELRKLVMERDGYKCQNCFCDVQPNDHVHHLSYDGYNNTGKTFAFECVTLCQSCHNEYHGKNQPKPEPDNYLHVDLSELGL